MKKRENEASEGIEGIEGTEGIGGNRAKREDRKYLVALYISEKVRVGSHNPNESRAGVRRLVGMTTGSGVLVLESIRTSSKK